MHICCEMQNKKAKAKRFGQSWAGACPLPVTGSGEVPQRSHKWAVLGEVAAASQLHVAFRELADAIQPENTIYKKYGTAFPRHPCMYGMACMVWHVWYGQTFSSFFVSQDTLCPPLCRHHIFGASPGIETQGVSHRVF